jgi:succinate-acetate transporter protein
LSTTDESSAAAPVAAAPELAVADPAPLGLAAFALTTFLLSAANAKLTKGTGDEWLGYAFAYGGLGQLIAGVFEFRNKNVFGATAFCTYGGFWVGLGLYIKWVPAGTGTLNDLGWILLSFAIFNTYMLIWSSQLNAAVFAVFLTLELTEIILFIGFFSSNTNIIKVGGYVGILTALCAWYTSAAGVIGGIKGRPVLPVGKPLGNIGG